MLKFKFKLLFYPKLYLFLLEKKNKPDPGNYDKSNLKCFSSDFYLALLVHAKLRDFYFI